MKTINFTTYKNHLTHLMGGTDEQHSQFIFDEGLEWLENYFNPYSELTKIYCLWWSKSAVFWNWYKLQYNVRCYEIIMSMGFDLDIHIISDLERTALIECFYEVHAKAMKIYPGMPVMEKIVKEINLKEVQHA